MCDTSLTAAPTASFPRTASSLRSSAVVESSATASVRSAEQARERSRQHGSAERQFDHPTLQHAMMVALLLWTLDTWDSLEHRDRELQYWIMWSSEWYRAQLAVNGHIEYPIDLEQLLTEAGFDHVKPRLTTWVDETPSE